MVMIIVGVKFTCRGDEILLTSLPLVLIEMEGTREKHLMKLAQDLIVNHLQV